jgi:hypothetical protein
METRSDTEQEAAFGPVVYTGLAVDCRNSEIGSLITSAVYAAGGNMLPVVQHFQVFAHID